MLLKADVKIRRDIDTTRLSPMEGHLAASKDGLLLNRAYFDMRGYDLEDARIAIREEAEVLAELADADWEVDAVEAVGERLMETGSYAGWFDIGTSAAVFALSSAGATPISSCNGGRIGGESHADDIPHILFSAHRSELSRISVAAETADVGLINNGAFAELFADDLPKLHRFAVALVADLAPSQG